MRTERILSIVLVLVLLASVVPLAVTPAGAQQTGIPCDNGDNELTKEELVNAIFPYMLGEEGAHTLDDAGDAAWVYAYWSGNPKTIKDSEGSDVTLYRPIERLVVGPTALVEWLRSVKAKDTIVGTGYTGTYEPAKVFFAEFADLPLVGNDAEAVLLLSPDAVLLSSTKATRYGGGKAIADACKAADIPVYALQLDRQDLINSYHVVTGKLGDIFDKEDEAEEYLDWYDSILVPITEKVEGIPEEDRPKVYFETYRYKAYGTYSYVAFAGGIDMFPNARGNIDPEAVADGMPDIIIKAPGGTQGGYGTHDTAEFEEIWDEIVNIRGGPEGELVDVPAVQNESVYIISTYLLSYMPASMGKHFLQIAYQAKWFNSTLFVDLDPKALHQEYLTRFQGLDIDLDEQGVFVYHPEKHPDGN